MEFHELLLIIAYTLAVTVFLAGLPGMIGCLILCFANCHMCGEHAKNGMVWDYDLEERRPICVKCGDAEVAAGKAKPIGKGQSPIFCDRSGSGSMRHRTRLS